MVRTKEAKAILVLHGSVIICKPNTSIRMYRMRTYLFWVPIIYTFAKLIGLKYCMLSWNSYFVDYRAVFVSRQLKRA